MFASISRCFIVIAAGIANYRLLVLSHERTAWISSAFAFERQPVAGRQTRHGKILQVSRVGSPTRLWLISQSPSKSPLINSTGWRSRAPAGAV